MPLSPVNDVEPTKSGSTPHIVPLPRQALDILRELYPLTGPTGPVFRSMLRRSEKSRYISDNTINVALRTIGYDIRERELTQAEAAKRMGLTQPKVSALLSGEFSNFSERKLMDCLNRLGYDIEIRVHKTPETVGHLMLTYA